MGATLTRNRNMGDESGEVSSQNAYRYPPKTGSYFGTHFIMGGERFESPQPGEFLFGESEELNLLGNKPIPFPYPVPTGNDPTKTLKSLVNIRKDSLRLIKAPQGNKSPLDGSSDGSGSPYTLEFIFDSDVRCSVQIHYFATEELVNGQVVYQPLDNSMSSEVFHYKRGAGQSFSQSSHLIDPSKYADTDWTYSYEKDVYPIAIHCAVEEEEHIGHAHITYAVIESNQEGCYNIKPLKQKQVVDGLCYLLQEIYGIENKNMERMKDIDPDDEVEDSGAECVICMSDMRDTLILPCRHLCLCSNCADSLRYQASMCPICRVKFRALLQIRAMRRKTTSSTNSSPQSEGEENPVNQEGVPQGYEAISLIEALNGQVVPPISNEGVHLQISSGPPLFAVEKKGHKETKVTVSGPIEYQKEMDTDKESNKGTLEKKDKETKVNVEQPNVTSDAGPDEFITKPVVKESAALKSTVVTVRCASDGSITTETKISPVRETELIPQHTIKRTEERGAFKTNINISQLPCGLSTGDMADDEREDSSEPDPDYDEHDSDDLVTMTSSSQPDIYASESASGSLLHIPASASQEDNFSSLQVMNMTDAQSSETEASSFDSNLSGQALLSSGQQMTSKNLEVEGDNEKTNDSNPIV